MVLRSFVSVKDTSLDTDRLCQCRHQLKKENHCMWAVSKSTKTAECINQQLIQSFKFEHIWFVKMILRQLFSYQDFLIKLFVWFLEARATLGVSFSLIHNFLKSTFIYRWESRRCHFLYISPWNPIGVVNKFLVMQQTNQPTSRKNQMFDWGYVIGVKETHAFTKA